MTARSSRVSRGAILVGLAVALAFGAWALTRNSLPKAESTAATRPVAPTVVPSAPAASAAPSP